MTFTCVCHQISYERCRICWGKMLQPIHTSMLVLVLTDIHAYRLTAIKTQVFKSSNFVEIEISYLNHGNLTRFPNVLQAFLIWREFHHQGCFSYKYWLNTRSITQTAISGHAHKKAWGKVGVIRRAFFIYIFACYKLLDEMYFMSLRCCV